MIALNNKTVSRTMGHSGTSILQRNSNAVASRQLGEAARSQLPKTKKNLQKSSNYQIRILKSLADIEEFETDWRALEEKSAKPWQVFQSYDWCANWARACTIGNDCYNTYVITVSRAGRCHLIWPMMATCSGPFHILGWFSEPYSQYGDVLICDEADKLAVLSLAWREIITHPYADSIRFRHVRADAAVAEFLKSHARADNHVDYAPFLEIDKFPTEQDYEARYNKSQRRRRKRIRKGLEQFGTVSFSLKADAGGFHRRLATAIAEKKTWLAERGLYSKPLASPELEPFFLALGQNGTSVETIASELKAGETPVSWEIGLRFKGRHFGYITAHDARMTDLSPSRLHMDLSQRAAIADKLTAFDLMVPGDPHKKTWSSNQVETRDYFTHLNPRGALYAAIYLKTLRPLVRWVYLKAPANIRRYFTGLLS